jgi:hypothetical protein
MSENILEFYNRLRSLFLSKDILYKTIEYKEGFRDCMYMIKKYIRENADINLLLTNKELKEENYSIIYKCEKQTKEIRRLLERNQELYNKTRRLSREIGKLINEKTA